MVLTMSHKPPNTFDTTSTIALTMVFMPLHKPLNMFTSPSIIFEKSPVNIPDKNSIIPLNIGFNELFHKSPIALTNVPKMLANTPNTTSNIGCKHSITIPISLKAGFKTLFHKSLNSEKVSDTIVIIVGNASLKRSSTHSIAYSIALNKVVTGSLI